MRSGLARILRARGGKRLLNVMYHGVVRKDSTWFSPRHITEQAFREQIGYLKREFDVISLAEAFEARASGRTLDRHTVTISFDDGYLNNLEVALPVIEESQVPVTIFVVGPCAMPGGDRVLWPDRVTMLRDRTNVHLEALGGAVYDHLIERQRKSHLFADLKLADPGVRDRVLLEITERYAIMDSLQALDPHIWKLMDPAQLLALSRSRYVEIGSHGYAHYNLGDITLAKATKDLKDSKNALEELLGKDVVSIAYPDGSYSVEVKDASERIGYKRQLAVDYRCIGDPADLRIQPRHGVSATTTSDSALFFLNRAFASRGVF